MAWRLQLSPSMTSCSLDAIPLTMLPKKLTRNSQTITVNSLKAEKSSANLPRKPREPLDKPGELPKRLKPLPRKLMRLFKI